jgi:peptidoglycan/xylan/chitin deacetylase (PgdA/CDA1 family)
MLHLPTHHRYLYSSIETRPQFQWPDGKRLAFYIGLNVEHFAFLAGLGSDPFGRASARQTQRNFAWRDYGLRVGIWRVFKMLDELQLPATILLNSLVCEHYPDVIERIKQRSDDICAHGRTNS